MTANTPLDNAKQIFDGIRRGMIKGSTSSTNERTAIETSDSWDDAKAAINCQDFTFLFLALARKAGLSTSYVWVERDFQDNFVTHACAGVFLSDGLLLVDSTYMWFGIPHKKFRVLDDLETVALYHSGRLEPALQDIGLQLSGNWSVPYFRVAFNRLADGRVSDAESALRDGLRIDSNSWWALAAKGSVATTAGDWAGIKDLEACLAIKPDSGWVHYYLGLAYVQQGQQGDLAKARDHLRTYLEREPDPKNEAKARSVLARISSISLGIRKAD